ncbi:helix-turn-helix transcriptional regulator [Actinopolymorpha sp. B17G11]|uniref:helix-turn-helix domain-containing protein n=1 Tax=Actinopolymorpha sp. B17G11 TaxID=3160861 RepID=UPI0032E51F94
MRSPPTVTPLAPADNPQVGDLLREWRRLRGRSQLDLALDTGVSARHLSFVETGRSQPSRRLLLALADQLDVPLRERNALLLAAGYAPAYTETGLDSAQSRAISDALERLLAGHEPYPALVLDRCGDVVRTNNAIAPLLVDVDAALLAQPINVYRLSLRPDGLAPRIRNRDDWTAHLGHRLTRLARLTGDPKLADLLAEIRRYPGVAAALDRPYEASSRELLLTLKLAHPAGELHLHSTVTSFGSPNDVTVAELAVESFFPADQQTRQILHRLTPTG